MQASNERERVADLIVVGGGLAGLMTAALAARAGRQVLVLERSSRPGGRAITRVEDGIHFNLGPHALYCRGRAFRLLEDLGVPFQGKSPDGRRAILTDGDRDFPIPRGIVSTLASRLLTAREKLGFLRLFSTLSRLDARRYDRVPLSQWIRDVAGRGNLARLIHVLCRVSTYADDPDVSSAGAAIDQLKLVLAGGVWYLDGGWQVLVDGLRDLLWQQDVEFRLACRAGSVRSDEGGVTVELSSGEELRGRAAVLAIDPQGAASLLGRAVDTRLTPWSEGGTPVRAASLDVALSRLPRPRQHVAFGLNRPLYYSVHSASARLAPAGVSVIHVMKYLGTDRRDSPEMVEAELEAFLDRLQPGWREHVVARQFLPGMIVANHLPRAEEGGVSGRPDVQVEGCPNVFLAGDWVGSEGLLADASAASAARAARRVLAAPARAGRDVSHATV
jgi:phytoene dehydrogenase-like protein